MAISPMKSNLIGSGLMFNNWSNLSGTSSVSNAQNKVNTTSASSLSKREAERLEKWQAALSKLNGKSNAQSGNKTAYTPASANEAAASGAATHGFFYHDIDALAMSATDDSATLSSDFAKDTLDFFTGGKYTQSDVDSLQKQMTDALKELGTQMQNDGKVDTGKLTNKITVKGTEMSLKDLADFQTVGQKLVPTFNEINGASRFDDMQSTAKMAVAKLTARRFGQGRGEAGQMFSNAMEGLYNKGMDRIDQYYTDPAESISPAYAQDTRDVRSQVTDLFSNIRTDNKSLMGHDFSNSVKGYTSLMNQQYKNFGTPIAYRTANAAAQQMGLYFNTLSRLLG